MKLQYTELSTAVAKFMALMEGPKFTHSDMFRHLRVEGRGDHLRLTLYTPSLEAEQHLYGVSPHENFLIGVPSKTFFDIVKLLPPQEITVDISEKFEISVGRIRFKLPYLREDVYPQILPESACDLTDIPYHPANISDLFPALGRVAYVSSQKHERPFARGVIVRPTHLLATDGSSRIITYPNEVIKVSETVLLPTESLTRAYRFFAGNPPGGGVFIITTDDGQPTDLLIRGAYPMFLKLRLGAASIPFMEKSLPSGEYQSQTIARIPFLMAVQRALSVANPVFPKGRLEFFRGSLIVESRHGESYHREEVSIISGAEKIAFILNLRALAEILQRIETEKLILRYYGPMMAVVLTDEKVRHINAIQPITS